MMRAVTTVSIAHARKLVSSTQGTNADMAGGNAAGGGKSARGAPKFPIHNEFNTVDGEKVCKGCGLTVPGVARSLTCHVDKCDKVADVVRAKYHEAAEGYRIAQNTSRKRRGATSAADGGVVVMAPPTAEENAAHRRRQALAWIECGFAAASLDRQRMREFLVGLRLGYRPLNAHAMRRSLDDIVREIEGVVDVTLGRGDARVKVREFCITTDDTTSIRDTTIATVSVVAPGQKGLIVNGKEWPEAHVTADKVLLLVVGYVVCCEFCADNGISNVLIRGGRLSTILSYVPAAVVTDRSRTNESAAAGLVEKATSLEYSDKERSILQKVIWCASMATLEHDRAQNDAVFLFV